MKKSISIILIILICLTANSAALASAVNGEGLNLSPSILHENEPLLDLISSTTPLEAKWKEIVSMPYGDGLGEVGLYKDDITTWGANVVLADDDGNIWL